MDLLRLIWIVSISLMVLSVVAWLVLCIMHWLEDRHQRQRQKYQDEWLARIMDWMDSDEVELPKPGNALEMEAVLLLIRDLIEKFKGQYQERLQVALDLLGAKRFAFQQLRSHFPIRRAAGIAVLNWCPRDKDVVSKLRQAIQDEDPRVRLEACLSLARMGKLQDVEHVLDALCKDEAADSLIARDLFRLCGENSKVDWARLLKKEWPPRQRILLLEAAGATGQTDLSQWITVHVMDPNPVVASAALQALGEIADPQAFEAVIEALRHPAAMVRRQAAHEIRACGDLKNSADALMALLDDEHFEVRRKAFRSLLVMGGEPLLRERTPSDHWQRELYLEAGLIHRESA